MSQGPTYSVPFRRRREGKTNYRLRQGLIKSGLPRATVRKSISQVQVQFITFELTGDLVVTQATSRELLRHGWEGSTSNTSAAYLTGILAGKRALAKGVEKAILDMGLQVPVRGCRVFALLKGLVDAGLEIPHGEDIFPSEERIQGTNPNLFVEVKEKLEGIVP